MSSRDTFFNKIDSELEGIKKSGLWKNERVIIGPQSTTVQSSQNNSDQTVVPLLNMCANNYLGFSSHTEIIAAAKKGIDDNGYGLSSVRFICGTQNIHKQLEDRLSGFCRKEDTILFSSCFDANAGLFETILNQNDAVISDSLNHASIIDGIRLCKAKRFRYANNNMEELRKCLVEAKELVSETSTTTTTTGSILIATDSVFSMDGIVCNLKGVCDLADEFGAIVMIDDSHASGVLGEGGRGGAAFRGVLDRVHILSSTLGKALGGGSGGWISGPKSVIALLRQRARPYLFSNSIPPATVAASLKALDLLEKNPMLLERLRDNAQYFRRQMELAGFTLSGADHAIIPIMTYDAVLASKLAEAMYRRGVFCVAFSFPVVPKEKARVRVQISAAHTRYQLDLAIRAFVSSGVEVGLLKENRKKAKDYSKEMMERTAKSKL